MRTQRDAAVCRGALAQHTRPRRDGRGRLRPRPLHPLRRDGAQLDLVLARMGRRGGGGGVSPLYSRITESSGAIFEDQGPGWYEAVSELRPSDEVNAKRTGPEGFVRVDAYATRIVGSRGGSGDTVSMTPSDWATLLRRMADRL